MIALTRIAGQPFVLNCDLIERVDSTPDTVVSLVDGKKYVVAETPREITAAVRLFRSEIIALSNHLQPESLYSYAETEPAPASPRECACEHGAGASEPPQLSAVTSIARRES